jgi:hypothetical protein
MHVPHGVPDYIPSPHNSDRESPTTYLQSRSPSQHPNGPPISPPKTRSASADDSSAALVEDWRVYTAKLRSQSEGERAHMAADRARMEEVMAEERALWDKEREILKARIAELEGQLEKRGSNTFIPHARSNRQSSVSVGPHPISFTSPGSNAVSITGSIDGSSSRAVPQESGRNADGSPFYAPAPRNPSRTFDASETSDLRVDSIAAPRESAIRVTSKELTSSDFGLQSPPHDLETIPEMLPESIDISHIQPELEGVPIKASAVSATFAAKVLSPQYSPSKLSPNIKPPPRDVTNVGSLSRSNSSAKRDKQATLEVVTAPENRRLTLHAGHTPNHSISKFDFLGGSESGNATPTQQHHPDHMHQPPFAPGHEDSHSPGEEDDGDNELSGPLGLTNESLKDDAFLAQLVEKLQEAQKSEGVSPSSESSSIVHRRSESLVSSRDRLSGDEDEKDADEGPVLRLRPSINFGRPMGSM